MGIKLLDNLTIEENLPNEKLFIDDNIFDLEKQSGTYEFGRINILWTLNIKDSKIEITFQNYNGDPLQSHTLSRDNPTAQFEDGEYYRLVRIKLDASFDNNQLILNGKRCHKLPHGPPRYRCNEYNNITVTSW